jgi:GIY-YIG catalytic domain
LLTEWSKLINENFSLKDIFLNNTPQIVYKKHKTIASYLTSAIYPTPWLETSNNSTPTVLQHNTSTIITKCSHPLCKSCINFKDLSHLPIFNNHKINTTNTLSCNSSNIIYLIHCNKCFLNYVGQTSRMLKERLNNHRSDIKNNKPTAISIHFNSPQHNISNLEIMPIQQLITNNDAERLEIEKLWIKHLHTIYPKGLNYYPITHQK